MDRIRIFKFLFDLFIFTYFCLCYGVDVCRLFVCVCESEDVSDSLDEQGNKWVSE